LVVLRFELRVAGTLPFEPLHQPPLLRWTSVLRFRDSIWDFVPRSLTAKILLLHKATLEVTVGRVLLPQEYSYPGI
jgi:hypothetical protein